MDPMNTLTRKQGFEKMNVGANRIIELVGVFQFLMKIAKVVKVMIKCS